MRNIFKIRSLRRTSKTLMPKRKNEEIILLQAQKNKRASGILLKNREIEQLKRRI